MKAHALEFGLVVVAKKFGALVAQCSCLRRFGALIVLKFQLWISHLLMNELFELRGKLRPGQQAVLGLLGLLFIIVLWWGLAEYFAFTKTLDPDRLELLDGEQAAPTGEKVYPILPTPLMVLRSFPDLVLKDDLKGNVLHSLWLNIRGYFWAVLISIPLGFLIGLIPLLRGMFSKPVDALRYLPLTALTGLFIIWFGIEDEMKIAFLAFGILVYLLPVVVQRIDEVQDVYLKTVFTLGATDWQTVKTIYLPSVLSKLIDDIRVLTAISWTYIIIAELLNRQGGIGALIYLKARQGQIPKVFALLIVIVLIGFLQDRLFVYLDKRLFPFKYYKTTLAALREIRTGLLILFGTMTVAILLQIYLPHFGPTLNMAIWTVLLAAVALMLFGEFKIRSSITESA